MVQMDKDELEEYLTTELSKEECGWYDIGETWTLYNHDISGLQEVEVRWICVRSTSNDDYVVKHVNRKGECVAEKTVDLRSLRKELQDRSKAHSHW